EKGLSRTITFKRSHVHVGFTAGAPSSQVAGGEKSIQQVAKVFINSLASLPQPAEPVETLAPRGNGAPNPLRAGIPSLHLDLLDVAALVTNYSVECGRVGAGKKHEVDAGLAEIEGLEKGIFGVPDGVGQTNENLFVAPGEGCCPKQRVAQTQGPGLNDIKDLHIMGAFSIV